MAQLKIKNVSLIFLPDFFRPGPSDQSQNAGKSPDEEGKDLLLRPYIKKEKN
jgi:hypothetical protein